jgi:hypothetical protein
LHESRYPFTIVLKREVTDAQPKACQVKIDPGAETTGIAVVQEDRVIWGAELERRA